MKNYSRRAALRTLPSAPRLAAQQRPPNVVFIMTDDQQRNAMSAYGNTVLETPNMDRIAAGRASFLTGSSTSTSNIPPAIAHARTEASAPLAGS